MLYLNQNKVITFWSVLLKSLKTFMAPFPHIDNTYAYIGFFLCVLVIVELTIAARAGIHSLMNTLGICYLISEL